MKGNKTYSTIEIVAVICCAIGCLLLFAPVLIDTEVDLFTIGLAFNAVGIVAFLFGRRTT